MNASPVDDAVDVRDVLVELQHTTLSRLHYDTFATQRDYTIPLIERHGMQWWQSREPAARYVSTLGVVSMLLFNASVVIDMMAVGLPAAKALETVRGDLVMAFEALRAASATPELAERIKAAAEGLPQ